MLIRKILISKDCQINFEMFDKFELWFLWNNNTVSYEYILLKQASNKSIGLVLLMKCHSY